MNYHFPDNLPEGEFKRLICCVIDFDKGIAILCNQRHAYMDVGAKVLQEHKTSAYKPLNSR